MLQIISTSLRGEKSSVLLLTNAGNDVLNCAAVNLGD